MTVPKFASPPPAIPDDIVRLSYPAPNILHVAMNRPKQFNAMSVALNETLNEVFDWYESEPSLWVAILGTTNPKAFCAGADLTEWLARQSRGEKKATLPRNGLAGLSNRFTRWVAQRGCTGRTLTA